MTAGCAAAVHPRRNVLAWLADGAAAQEVGNVVAGHRLARTPNKSSVGSALMAVAMAPVRPVAVWSSLIPLPFPVGERLTGASSPARSDQHITQPHPPLGGIDAEPTAEVRRHAKSQRAYDSLDGGFKRRLGGRQLVGRGCCRRRGVLGRAHSPSRGTPAMPVLMRPDRLCTDARASSSRRFRTRRHPCVRRERRSDRAPQRRMPEPPCRA